MRYFLLIFIGFLSTLSVVTYASESKSDSTSPIQHTPHPPHDHPNNDHLKKLDEGMNRRRKNESD